MPRRRTNRKFAYSWPAQVEETTSDQDHKMWQERLAKLAGGAPVIRAPVIRSPVIRTPVIRAAVIRAGGSTEVEVKERRDRVNA